jgi:hypothetical protein
VFIPPYGRSSRPNQKVVYYTDDENRNIDPTTLFLISNDKTDINSKIVDSEEYYQSSKSIIRIKEVDMSPTENQIAKDPVSILYDNILELIQPLFSASGIRFDRNTTLFINSIVQTYNISKESIMLSRTYLKYIAIDINFPMEKYPEYTKFVNIVKKYIVPERESYNTNLQELINDYAYNQTNYTETNTKSEFALIADELFTCFDKFNPVCKSLSDIASRDAIQSFAQTTVDEININKGSEHKYEAYVHVDVVEGVLNASNTSKINCAYQDSILTDRFEIMANVRKHGNWLLLPAPFITIPPSTEKSKLPTRKADKKGGKKTRKNRNGEFSVPS